jgi:excisionase family DNA binding protein
MSGSLLSAREVAEMLGVPTSWVYEQSRRGRIPTVTLGRYRRYRREAIERWLGELEAGDGGERGMGAGGSAGHGRRLDREAALVESGLSVAC